MIGARTARGGWPGRSSGTRRLAPAVKAAAALALVQAGAPCAASGLTMHEVDVRASRGTWMTVDVTPDGRHLVFDLLGDIYRVPVSGGVAATLVSGPVESPGIDDLPAKSVSHSPAISPDGALLFISDRGGSENLWVLDAEGGSARQITGLDGVSFNSPAWTDDGRAAVVRRSTTGREGELWRYEIATGDGSRLPVNEGFVDLQGPWLHGDELYFASPPAAEGARPLRRETWQIMRAALYASAAEQITDTPAGAVRPRVSPDGRWLAYATWRGGKSSLVLRDRRSGSEKVIVSGISRNLQDMYIAQLDLLPGYAFSPDSRSIFVARHGKLTAVTVPGGRIRELNFEVRTTVAVPRSGEIRIGVPEAGFSPRTLRWPAAAGAGDLVVLEALGRLWSVDADRARSRRPEALTPEHLFATQPQVAPDGRIVFLATDVDGARHIMLRNVDGSIETLAGGAAAYAAPRFSTDGGHVLAVRAPPGAALGLIRPGSEHEARRLVRIDMVSGAEETLLAGDLSEAGAWASSRARSLWIMTERGLVLHQPANGAERLLVPRGQADLIVPSPSGKRAAVAIGNHVIVDDMQGAAAAVESLSQTPPPYSEFPGELGHFPAWIDDETLMWTVPGGLRVAPADSLAEGVRLDVRLEARPPFPSRPLLLRGARIVTMSDRGIIEEGEIAVVDGRLSCVAALGECSVPEGSAIADISGRTVIPGLIDVHQHALALMGESAMKGVPRHYPPASLLLAYGVTSTRDPALLSNVRDFALIESINAGRVDGPRYFATGERVMPSRVRIEGPRDARRIVADLIALGATSIKEYLLRDRRQRHWLREAAAEAGVRITFEGGYDYKLSLTGVLDGYDGIEHSAGNHLLHEDALCLLGGAEIDYTPTILTQIGAERFYRRYDILEEARLRRYAGVGALRYLIERPRRGQGVAPEETAYAALTSNAARAARAGASVAVGAHDAPAPTGLGTHWEIWSLVEGGMSAHEALEAATIVGARVLGIDREAGSLEPGKLADLLVLAGNPLTDIRNTLSLETVIRNGRLYDSLTLEPVRIGQRREANDDAR